MAIYKPSFLQPNGISFCAATPHIFSTQTNGYQISKYQILIYNMNNVLQYDSTIITPATPYYDKETIYFTLPAGSLTDGQQLKWIMKNWETTTSATPTTSLETPFFVYTTPLVKPETIPSPITAKSHQFRFTYTQSQGIPLKRWRIHWKEEDGTIITTSDWSYRGSIIYEIDGLSDETNYRINCEVENQVGETVSSGDYSFTVNYDKPNLLIVPSATIDDDTSAVQVSWNKAVQIDGVTTGTYSYVPDFLYEGNYALELDELSTLTYSLSIPVDFSCTFLLQLPVGFEGTFCKLDNSYLVGYENRGFAYTINGITEYTLPVDVSDGIFYIVLQPTIVRFFIMKKDWESYSANTWDNLDELTWNELYEGQNLYGRSVLREIF